LNAPRIIQSMQPWIIALRFTVRPYRLSTAVCAKFSCSCVLLLKYTGWNYFVLWPTNAQLFHKLSYSYLFRHYRVILRELVISILPSYTSISNAAVGNTVYN